MRNLIVGNLVSSGTPQSRFALDSIELTYGQHDLEILVAALPFIPNQVFVSVDDGNSQVCGAGSGTTVQAELIDGGFQMVADVKSNTCVVTWMLVGVPLGLES